jgi:hypothetical protein
MDLGEPIIDVVHHDGKQRLLQQDNKDKCQKQQ